MGRGRKLDPRAGPAKELYEQGWKLSDIAKKFDISPGTVRRWKSEQNWDKEDSERSELNSERSEINIERSEINRAKKEVKKAQKKEDDPWAAGDQELSEKQRLFCLFYVRTFNATQAYKKAYKCSYNTAMTNGSRMLRIAKVQDEIKRLKKERCQRELLGEDDIFQRYLEIAHSDITDYIEFGSREEPVITKDGVVMVEDEENGGTKVLTERKSYAEFKNSDEVDGTMITEVKMGRQGLSIKLLDKMKALQWLDENIYKAKDDAGGVIMMTETLEDEDECDMETTAETEIDDAET